MKKVISLVLATAILISAFFCMSLTASAIPLNADDQWILDFGAGQAVIDRDVYIDSSLKTSAAYSSSEDAAVFTSSVNNLTSATRTPGFIVGGTVTSGSTKALSVTSSSIAKYPVLAFRIKLSDADMILDRIDWTTDKYEETGSGKWRDIKSNLSLSATTEWQTLYFDTSTDANGTTQAALALGGNWSGFRFFFKTPEGKTEATSVTFAWAGVFATAADALAYETERQETLDNTWEIDFAKDGISAVNSMQVTNSAAKAFSSEEGAAAFTSTLSNLDAATRSPSLLFGRFSNVSATSVTDANVNVTRNRILAVKLKLNNADITFDGVNWSATASDTRYVNNPNNALVATTDWQLVCLDIGDSSNVVDFVPENTYTGFRLLFKSPAGKSTPATIYVEYIKLFETVDDAEAYENARQSAKNENKAMVIDFADENNTAAHLMRHNELNRVSYDYSTSVSRIKMIAESAANDRGPAFDIVTLSEESVSHSLPFNASVKDYPIIAIRIRLSNEALTITQSGDSANGRLDWLTTTGVTGDTPSDLKWRDMKNYVMLNETTDWQTICIDTRTLTNGNDLTWLSGDWAGLRILFDGDSASQNDFIEIKWAGFFKDMAAVSAQESINKVYGDANDDGTFNVVDLIRAKRYLAKATDEINLEMADLCKDSVLNAEDLIAIRARLLK